MSSEKANLQGSDGTIPAKGDDHQVQPSIIMSSTISCVKDFAFLQRQLATAQQTYNQSASDCLPLTARLVYVNCTIFQADIFWL